MARKPRVEFEGAFYHVIARGNQRRSIFSDDRDRKAYLARIERYRKRYNFTIYGYVLMSNHVHLLIQSGKVPLSKIMQGIQGGFTQRYNRQHRTAGHLFQGRFKAILCDRDAYLLELVRYIHLNPVRIRQPHDPWEYRWSSHRAYLGERTPVEVKSGELLAQLGPTMAQARRSYVRFMEEGLSLGHLDKFYQTIDQRFLGDEEFVESIERKAEEKEGLVAVKKVSFQRLLEVVAAQHGLAPERFTDVARRRSLTKPRSLLVYLARHWSGMTSKELGLRLRRDGSMISRLYTTYAEQRDPRVEARTLRLLTNKSITRSDPSRRPSQFK
jgi:REP element-mobilizing transposase RayT